VFGDLNGAIPGQIQCSGSDAEPHLGQSSVWGFVWSYTWANPVFGDLYGAIPGQILCLGMRARNHRWATLRRRTLTGLTAALLTNMLLTPWKLVTHVLLARKLLML